MPVSDRTRLALIKATDAQSLFDYFQRNATHLRPWEPARDVDYDSHEAWQKRAASQEKANAAGTAFHFAIRPQDDEDIIGLCTFSNIVRGAFQACHLGYSIDQRQEGNGLMCEALSITIPFVFETARLHRIMANYIPANKRSGRLLEKLGFEKEGYAKEYLQIAGVWQDHILTSRINR